MREKEYPMEKGTWADWVSTIGGGWWAFRI